jgi:hypothetical protein
MIGNEDFKLVKVKATRPRRSMRMLQTCQQQRTTNAKHASKQASKQEKKKKDSQKVPSQQLSTTALNDPARIPQTRILGK